MGSAGAMLGVFGGWVNHKQQKSALHDQSKVLSRIYLSDMDAANTEDFLGEMAFSDAEFAAEMRDMAASMEAGEVYVEASRVGEENDRTIRNIQLQYLQNGVEMSGSPLLVMEAARKESEMELEAYEKRASNILAMGEMETNQIMARGKASLTRSSIISAGKRRAAGLNLQAGKAGLSSQSANSAYQFYSTSVSAISNYNKNK